MRTSRRRPTAAAGFVLGLATVAAVASGCSLVSPTANSTYSASDGSNAEIGTVKLRNFLVVSAAQGKPGVVVGAVSTDGAAPVQVRLTVLGADGSTPLGEATVTAQPGQLSNVGTGTGAAAIQLSAVPVQPGANLTLRAATDAGGTDVKLPVLPQTEQYATITPSASATPTPSVTPSASVAVSPTPSLTPTHSPAVKQTAKPAGAKHSAKPTPTKSANG